MYFPLRKKKERKKVKCFILFCFNPKRLPISLLAIYNFSGVNDSCIKLNVGDTVHILEELGGWYFGYALHNKALRGVFPKSFIQVSTASVVIKPKIGINSIYSQVYYVFDWVEFYENLVKKSTLDFMYGYGGHNVNILHTWLYIFVLD